MGDVVHGQREESWGFCGVVWFWMSETKRVGERTNVKLVINAPYCSSARHSRYYRSSLQAKNSFSSCLPLNIGLTIIARVILRRGHGTRPTADALSTLSKGLH